MLDLRALAVTAAEAQRALEAAIAAADAEWNDGARRRFDGDHLAGIRADARLLRDELDGLDQTVSAALRLMNR